MPIQNEKFGFTVRDNTTGAPLSGALVELNDGSSNYVLTEISTSGFYQIASIPTGKYDVVINSVSTGQTMAVGSGQIAALGNEDDNVPVSTASAFEFQDATGLKTTLALENVNNVAVPIPSVSDQNKYLQVDSNGDYVLGAVNAAGLVQTFEVLTTSDLRAALEAEFDYKTLIVNRGDFNFINNQTFDVFGVNYIINSGNSLTWNNSAGVNVVFNSTSTGALIFTTPEVRFGIDSNFNYQFNDLGLFVREMDTGTLSTISGNGAIFYEKDKGIDFTNVSIVTTKQFWDNTITTAEDLPYDNTTSGLTATEVQGAIDELSSATSGISDINNIGVGSEVYKQTTGAGIAELRTLTAGSNVTITQNANDLEISATGGISDAPSDSTTYFRKNASWVNDYLALTKAFRTGSDGEQWVDNLGRHMFQQDGQRKNILGGNVVTSTETNLDLYPTGVSLTPASGVTNLPAWFSPTGRMVCNVYTSWVGFRSSNQYLVQELIDIDSGQKAMRTLDSSSSWGSWEALDNAQSIVANGATGPENNAWQNGPYYMTVTSGSSNYPASFGLVFGVKEGTSRHVQYFYERFSSNAYYRYQDTASDTWSSWTRVGDVTIDTAQTITGAKTLEALLKSESGFYNFNTATSITSGILDIYDQALTGITAGNLYTGLKQTSTEARLYAGAGTTASNSLQVYIANSSGIEIHTATFKDSALNLSSTTNSSPSNGDIWYDGTNLKGREGGATFNLNGGGGTTKKRYQADFFRAGTIANNNTIQLAGGAGSTPIGFVMPVSGTIVEIMASDSLTTSGAAATIEIHVEKFASGSQYSIGAGTECGRLSSSYSAGTTYNNTHYTTSPTNTNSIAAGSYIVPHFVIPTGSPTITDMYVTVVIEED